MLVINKYSTYYAVLVKGSIIVSMLLSVLFNMYMTIFNPLCRDVHSNKISKVPNLLNCKDLMLL